MIEDKLSLFGYDLADTKASGQPANILAGWTGAGWFFAIVLVAFAIVSAMKNR